MQQASFSIINYQFDKVNIDLEQHNSKDLKLGFSTNGVFDIQNKTYELVFLVQIKQNEDSTPFVEVRCKGTFKFENVNTLEDVPDFFYRNCIAILFPYVRAYLSLITTQANVPGIILPTYNLSGLELELKKNTTQK